MIWCTIVLQEWVYEVVIALNVGVSQKRFIEPEVKPSRNRKDRILVFRVNKEYKNHSVVIWRLRLRISLREAVKPDWLILNDELLQGRMVWEGKSIER